MEKSSWHFILTIDQHGNITTDEEQIDREKHITICRCGKKRVKIVLFKPDVKRKYESIECKYCGNEDFTFCTMYRHFHNSLYEEFDPFRYNDLVWNFSRAIIGHARHVYANLILPFVDIKENKISFINKKMLNINITENAEIQKIVLDEMMFGIKLLYFPITKQNNMGKAETKKRRLFAKLERNLIDFILEKPFVALKWLTSQSPSTLTNINSIEKVGLLLRSPSIQDLDLLHWELFKELDVHLKNCHSIEELLKCVINHKKQKTVLKTFFKSYLYGIENKKYYNPKADFVFSRTIENVDFLASVIGQNSIKSKLFKKSNVSDAIWLIKFLKTRYKEKNIVALVNNEIMDYEHFWQDSISMASMNKTALEQHFKRVKCKIREIHDEISRCLKIQRIRNIKSPFHHTDIDLQRQSEVKEFSFKLPIDTLELFRWSEILDNCMFSYEDQIRTHKSAIYGVFKNEELHYALEIIDGDLIQAFGYKNCRVPKKDMDIIDIWSKKNHINLDIIKMRYEIEYDRADNRAYNIYLPI